jgi:hypothetical protein
VHLDQADASADRRTTSSTDRGTDARDRRTEGAADERAGQRVAEQRDRLVAPLARPR